MHRRTVATTPHRRCDGGKSRGYGWPATLELLSSPATPGSCHLFKMVICPACGSVHEEDGVCISRRIHPTSFIIEDPAAAMGNDNPGELNARTIPQLIAANLFQEDDWT